jgi:hypothetical protein
LDIRNRLPQQVFSDRIDTNTGEVEELRIAPKALFRVMDTEVGPTMEVQIENGILQIVAEVVVDDTKPLYLPAVATVAAMKAITDPARRFYGVQINVTQDPVTAWRGVYRYDREDAPTDDPPNVFRPIDGKGRWVRWSDQNEISHQTRVDIQGGSPTERYHLTQSQHAAAANANAPSASNPFATIADTGAGPGADKTRIENIELSAVHIAGKQVSLAETPVGSIALDVFKGTAQIQGTDFAVSGNVISWNGLPLESLLEIGDILRVQYNVA